MTKSLYFVLENNSAIALHAQDLAYHRIQPYLSEYMGPVFEEICKQYLWKQLIANQCPINFHSLARWWGNDPNRKCQAEIDMMGEQDKHTALFGECKWINEAVDHHIPEALIKKSEIFSYQKQHFYLFAKKGFTRQCKEKANVLGNVTLVSYKDILKSQN